MASTSWSAASTISIRGCPDGGARRGAESSEISAPSGDSIGLSVCVIRRNIVPLGRSNAATQQRSSGKESRRGRRAWRSIANADPVLARRGRYLNTICQLDIGADTVLLRIIDGRITEVRAGPFVTPSAVFAISGEAAVWRRLLAANPQPGDHDLLAFVKRG